jgi:hypothetical protein
MIEDIQKDKTIEEIHPILILKGRDQDQDQDILDQNQSILCQMKDIALLDDSI